MSLKDEIASKTKVFLDWGNNSIRTENNSKREVQFSFHVSTELDRIIEVSTHFKFKDSIERWTKWFCYPEKNVVVFDIPKNVCLVRSDGGLITV